MWTLQLASYSFSEHKSAMAVYGQAQDLRRIPGGLLTNVNLEQDDVKLLQVHTKK